MTDRIQFVDLTLRDGQQSLAATRMTTDQALRVLPMLNDAGYAAFELWGGATLDSCVRFLDEDPWERLDRFYATLGTSHRTRILLRGQNLFAYQPFPDDLVIAFTKEAVRSGVGIVRLFDALNDWRNLQLALLATKAYGGKAEAALCYTTSPVHTTEYFVRLARTLEEEGADQIAIKDMAGLLYPTQAFDFFEELKHHLRVPITFHSHTTTGVATLNAVIAMYAGIDFIDTAITPFAGGPSHPPIEILTVFAEELGLEHGLDKELILRIQKVLFDIFDELHSTIPLYGQYYRPVTYDDIDRHVVQQILAHIQKGREENIEAALTLMRALMRDLRYPDYDDTIFKAQIPGGMLSNLQNQLKQMQKLDLLDAIMQEIPRVRADVGYVPLVTPTSQIVGAQATFNVLMGRYQMVSNEFKMLLRGEFGHLPVPPNPEIVQKVLGPGESPLRYRPASYLMPVLEDKCDLPYVKTHRDLLLHFMLKQPADEFLKRKYGILNGN
ncbi:MAG TPA: oxaloacetate decarboxylase subunit alpha [Anaerolineae bacterium]|nr:oxaloacetate decarboxylase subunit alpha [Anaerolineae bacterium]HQK14073.1 oxaloacetate decarboxylase subunit alpha [Anaerolineae bacterium]